jgi:hypothetical protein
MSTPVIDARSLKPTGDAPPSGYKRIYVWQFPVRLFHWVTAISIVLLCATGFLIGHPLHAFYAEQAYQQYWFGWLRFHPLRQCFCGDSGVWTAVVLGLCWKPLCDLEELPSPDTSAVARHVGFDSRGSSAD